MQPRVGSDYIQKHYKSNEQNIKCMRMQIFCRFKHLKNNIYARIYIEFELKIELK